MRIHPFARFFVDRIYRVSYVVVCCPRAEFRRHVARLLRKNGEAADVSAVLRAFDESPGLPDDCSGRIYRLRPEGSRGLQLPIVLIWLSPRASLGTVVHEASHAAQWVFSICGVDTNDLAADEPLAYYLEWIVAEILQLRY